MSNIVNLKRHRKRLDREQSAKQAEINRVRFGRTKAERLLERQRVNRAQEELDRHRLDYGVGQ